MSSIAALLAILSCSPVLTASAKEPSLKAGDYAPEMNIKAMGDRAKQSKPANMTPKTTN